MKFVYVLMKYLNNTSFTYVITVYKLLTNLNNSFIRSCETNFMVVVD